MPYLWYFYQFEEPQVSGTRVLAEGIPAQDAYVKLRTEGDIATQKINVTVTELSK
ncbi:MAG: hypothetical protein WCI18_14945 [Pseudomonadota bacterium]